MKPIDVTSDSYAEYNEDFNKKDPRLKVGDHVRISKYENIFSKGCTPNWSEEVFGVSVIKLKIQVRGLTLLVIWMVKKLLEVLWKRIVKNGQEKFRIEKVLKRKRDKLSVK